MQAKTLKHKTLPDTYGHPINMPGEFGHCAIPLLQPMTATLEGLKKLYYNQPMFLEQLNDYDLVTVWVSQPLPPGVDTAALDDLAKPEVIKSWQEAFKFLKQIVPEDPLEYISQYLPREIVIDGRGYVFQLFLNHPHYDFRVYYEAAEPAVGELSFRYLYENASNCAELLENLKDLRKDLEEADLLPDLYKGNGYTKELFDKEYFPGLKADE